ncbi:MAG: HEAT repeat domain-containing protein [Candidatus Diapherotrites archaeon]|nr:HEAT repeat domain-containing protein [Candidatus Diapherotrites archaeon]
MKAPLVFTVGSKIPGKLLAEAKRKFYAGELGPKEWLPGEREPFARPAPREAPAPAAEVAERFPEEIARFKAQMATTFDARLDNIIASLRQPPAAAAPSTPLSKPQEDLMRHDLAFGKSVLAAEIDTPTGKASLTDRLSPEHLNLVMKALAPARTVDAEWERERLLDKTGLRSEVESLTDRLKQGRRLDKEDVLGIADRLYKAAKEKGYAYKPPELRPEEVSPFIMRLLKKARLDPQKGVTAEEAVKAYEMLEKGLVESSAVDALRAVLVRAGHQVPEVVPPVPMLGAAPRVAEGTAVESAMRQIESLRSEMHGELNWFEDRLLAAAGVMPAPAEAPAGLEEVRGVIKGVREGAIEPGVRAMVMRAMESAARPRVNQLASLAKLAEQDGITPAFIKQIQEMEQHKLYKDMNVFDILREKASQEPAARIVKDVSEPLLRGVSKELELADSVTGILAKKPRLDVLVRAIRNNEFTNASREIFRNKLESVREGLSSRVHGLDITTLKNITPKEKERLEAQIKSIQSKHEKALEFGRETDALEKRVEAVEEEKREQAMQEYAAKRDAYRAEMKNIEDHVDAFEHVVEMAKRNELPATGHSINLLKAAISSMKPRRGMARKDMVARAIQPKLRQLSREMEMRKSIKSKQAELEGALEGLTEGQRDLAKNVWKSLFNDPMVMKHGTLPKVNKAMDVLLDAAKLMRDGKVDVTRKSLERMLEASKAPEPLRAELVAKYPEMRPAQIVQMEWNEARRKRIPLELRELSASIAALPESQRGAAEEFVKPVLDELFSRLPERMEHEELREVLTNIANFRTLLKEMKNDRITVDKDVVDTVKSFTAEKSKAMKEYLPSIRTAEAGKPAGAMEEEGIGFEAISAAPGFAEAMRKKTEKKMEAFVKKQRLEKEDLEKRKSEIARMTEIASMDISDLDELTQETLKAPLGRLAGSILSVKRLVEEEGLRPPNVMNAYNDMRLRTRVIQEAVRIAREEKRPIDARALELITAEFERKPRLEKISAEIRRTFMPKEALKTLAQNAIAESGVTAQGRKYFMSKKQGGWYFIRQEKPVEGQEPKLYMIMEGEVPKEIRDSLVAQRDEAIAWAVPSKSLKNKWVAKVKGRELDVAENVLSYASQLYDRLSKPDDGAVMEQHQRVFGAVQKLNRYVMDTRAAMEAQNRSEPTKEEVLKLRHGAFHAEREIALLRAIDSAVDRGEEVNESFLSVQKDILKETPPSKDVWNVRVSEERSVPIKGEQWLIRPSTQFVPELYVRVNPDGSRTAYTPEHLDLATLSVLREQAAYQDCLSNWIRVPRTGSVEAFVRGGVYHAFELGEGGAVRIVPVRNMPKEVSDAVNEVLGLRTEEARLNFAATATLKDEFGATSDVKRAEERVRSLYPRSPELVSQLVDSLRVEAEKDFVTKFHVTDDIAGLSEEARQVVEQQRQAAMGKVEPRLIAGPLNIEYDSKQYRMWVTSDLRREIWRLDSEGRMEARISPARFYPIDEKVVYHDVTKLVDLRAVPVGETEEKDFGKFSITITEGRASYQKFDGDKWVRVRDLDANAQAKLNEMIEELRPEPVHEIKPLTDEEQAHNELVDALHEASLPFYQREVRQKGDVQYVLDPLSEVGVKNNGIVTVGGRSYDLSTVGGIARLNAAHPDKLEALVGTGVLETPKERWVDADALRVLGKVPAYKELLEFNAKNASAAGVGKEYAGHDLTTADGIKALDEGEVSDLVDSGVLEIPMVRRFKVTPRTAEFLRFKKAPGEYLDAEGRAYDLRKPKDLNRLASADFEAVQNLVKKRVLSNELDLSDPKDMSVFRKAMPANAKRYNKLAVFDSAGNEVRAVASRQLKYEPSDLKRRASETVREDTGFNMDFVRKEEMKIKVVAKNLELKAKRERGEDITDAEVEEFESLKGNAVKAFEDVELSERAEEWAAYLTSQGVALAGETPEMTAERLYSEGVIGLDSYEDFVAVGSDPSKHTGVRILDELLERDTEYVSPRQFSFMPSPTLVLGEVPSLEMAEARAREADEDKQKIEEAHYVLTSRVDGIRSIERSDPQTYNLVREIRRFVPGTKVALNPDEVGTVKTQFLGELKQLDEDAFNAFKTLEARESSRNKGMKESQVWENIHDILMSYTSMELVAPMYMEHIEHARTNLLERLANMDPEAYAAFGALDRARKDDVNERSRDLVRFVNWLTVRPEKEMPGDMTVESRRVLLGELQQRDPEAFNAFEALDRFQEEREKQIRSYLNRVGKTRVSELWVNVKGDLSSAVNQIDENIHRYAVEYLPELFGGGKTEEDVRENEADMLRSMDDLLERIDYEQDIWRVPVEGDAAAIQQAKEEYDKREALKARLLEAKGRFGRHKKLREFFSGEASLFDAARAGYSPKMLMKKYLIPRNIQARFEHGEEVSDDLVFVEKKAKSGAWLMLDNHLKQIIQRPESVNRNWASQLRSKENKDEVVKEIEARNLLPFVPRAMERAGKARESYVRDPAFLEDLNGRRIVDVYNNEVVVDDRAAEYSAGRLNMVGDHLVYSTGVEAKDLPKEALTDIGMDLIEARRLAAAEALSGIVPVVGERITGESIPALRFDELGRVEYWDRRGLTQEQRERVERVEREAESIMRDVDDDRFADIDAVIEETRKRNLDKVQREMRTVWTADAAISRIQSDYKYGFVGKRLSKLPGVTVRRKEMKTALLFEGEEKAFEAADQLTMSIDGARVEQIRQEIGELNKYSAELKKMDKKLDTTKLDGLIAVAEERLDPSVRQALVRAEERYRRITGGEPNEDIERALREGTIVQAESLMDNYEERSVKAAIEDVSKNVDLFLKETKLEATPRLKELTEALKRARSAEVIDTLQQGINREMKVMGATPLGRRLLELDDVLRENPRDTDALKEMVSVLQGLGHPREDVLAVIDALESALPDAEKDTAGMIRRDYLASQGVRVKKRRVRKRAVTVPAEGVEGAPGEVAAPVDRVDAELASGVRCLDQLVPDEALEHANNALELEPGSKAAMRMQLRALDEVYARDKTGGERDVEAIRTALIASCDALIQVNPEELEAFRVKAQALSDAKQFDNAAAVLASGRARAESLGSEHQREMFDELLKFVERESRAAEVKPIEELLKGKVTELKKETGSGGPEAEPIEKPEVGEAEKQEEAPPEPETEPTSEDVKRAEALSSEEAEARRGRPGRLSLPKHLGVPPVEGGVGEAPFAEIKKEAPAAKEVSPLELTPEELSSQFVRNIRALRPEDQAEQINSMGEEPLNSLLTEDKTWPYAHIKPVSADEKFLNSLLADDEVVVRGEYPSDVPEDERNMFRVGAVRRMGLVFHRLPSERDRIIRSLVDLLSDPDNMVRANAAKVLREDCGKSALPILRKRFSGMNAYGQRKVKDIFDDLGEKFEEPEEQVEEPAEAARAMVFTRTKLADEVLRSGSKPEQLELLREFDRFIDRDAFDFLRMAVTDASNYEARIAAINSVVKRENEHHAEVVDSLQKALQDGSRNVRMLAIERLGEVGGEKSIAPLSALVNRRGKEGQAVKNAIKRINERLGMGAAKVEKVPDTTARKPSVQFRPLPPGSEKPRTGKPEGEGAADDVAIDKSFIGPIERAMGAGNLTLARQLLSGFEPSSKTGEDQKRLLEDALKAAEAHEAARPPADLAELAALAEWAAELGSKDPSVVRRDIANAALREPELVMEIIVSPSTLPANVELAVQELLKRSNGVELVEQLLRDKRLSGKARKVVEDLLSKKKEADEGWEKL